MTACTRADSCGREHPGCGAHGRSGAPCRASALRGSSPARCRYHLGKRTADFKAERDLVEQARKITGLSQSEPVDVEQVLSEHLALAGEARQWKDTLRAMVEQLDSVGYEAKAGEQVRAAVRLYSEALDRLDKMLSNIAKLRIEERLAAVEEAREVRLRAVLIAALDRLDLQLRTPEVADAVRLAITDTEPKRLVR